MSEVQAQALEFFVGLRAHRTSWRGVLLLGVGLNEAGRALALASLAAGAAGLFLEDDHPSLGLAQREGCVTFTVTTLGEAIRILKNDVRRGSAVSVALRTNPDDAMAEMVRRGLQPNAVAFSQPAAALQESSAGHLLQRGATLLCGVGSADERAAVNLQQQASAAMGTRWQFATDLAASFQLRGTRDRELLAEAERSNLPDDPVAGFAQDWLRAAPRLQPRTLSRAFLLRATAAKNRS